MNAKKLRLLLACGAVLLVILAVVLITSLGGNPVATDPNWIYSYEWNDGKCTATRVSRGSQPTETETADGILHVEIPATKDKAGKGYYTVKFQKAEFNENYNLGDQPVIIPAGSDFAYGKAGLNTYLLDSDGGKYYYAQMDIGDTTQSGWVGFIHNAGDTFSTQGTYFYDAVSYKAGKNYEHGFGSVIDGENLFENTETADAFEGATKKGLTGADFTITGMTMTTIRADDRIYLFINDKRIATYLIDDELAETDTVPGLYFDTNSTFYSGTLSNIDVVVGKAETEEKLSALMSDNDGFLYSNCQNWNKNEGLHTGATFDVDSFTYQYDAELDLDGFDIDLEGYTLDRRFMSGVTDRVFLSGSYFYQYEISGPLQGVNGGKEYGLFFNWVNSAQRSGIYYMHEAMLCLKENKGLEKVHFDAGSGTNGDGVSGWVGGIKFGGSDNLKSNAAWQAAYKEGLIVRICRLSYSTGEKATYAMSVTAKSNPKLVLHSSMITVDNEDKEAIYGGYDWILFGSQSVNCTISNVTYGRIDGEAEIERLQLHDWEYSYDWYGSLCTATRTCQHCGKKEYDSAEGKVVKVISVPTKNKPGEVVYSAVFKNSDYEANKSDICTNHTAKLSANSPFYISNGGKQSYPFNGVDAGKYYYVEMKLSAPTTQGYVGIAHWSNSKNYFSNTVSYDQTGNYYYAFSSTVDGAWNASIEPCKYFEGDTLTGLTGADFGKTGMTLAALRMDGVIHTFINGKRVATYLIEDELAAINTTPMLYFNDNNGYYNGKVNEVVVVTGQTATQKKLAELVTGSGFSYVNTPGWNKGTHTDATFTSNGFTYAYDSSVSTGDRRFVTGVNDRVFIAGDYYYQYEISGDMSYANGSNVYGLFYNWINSKTQTQYGNYKHEANFCLKLNSQNKLERLTFDKGSGANGDGASGWVCNTTAYGGNNTLASDEAWQKAYKEGLVVRITRTVKNNTTDVYVISVMAKNDPSLKLVSDPIEVSDATFGGYNWILFGTQSVNCTISNVTYGRIPAGHSHDWEYNYTWSTTQCAAVRTCRSCGETEGETVKAQPVKVSPATKDSAGEAIYSAVFENSDFTDNCTDYVVKFDVNAPFSIAEGGKQSYTFDGVDASKYYYMEMKLSAPTSAGYAGIAHWFDSNHHFYDAVSYAGADNYRHAFSSVLSGAGRVYSELAKYYEGDTLTGLTGAEFGKDGMILATLRMNDVIHTFINGKRIATYVIEKELAAINTVPALYFNDDNGYYDGSVNDIVIVTGQSATQAKLNQLTSGSTFTYANTPNWNKGTHTDATFSGNGFTYAYDAGVSTGDRRYVTGVNDRVFLAGNYYYQYEISGDMASASGSNLYGLLYNWINTKSPTGYGNYKHEANFVLKLNGDKLQRLTFDKGSGANGDGSAGWVSNTTAYGGNNTLESNAAWQEAYKGGLIVRIERISTSGTTDKYKITVTAKNNPELKLESSEIEVSDSTFGGYNWILFGTQSVNCTISNVTYGRIYNYSDTGTVVKAPTCGEPGIMRYTCTDPGFTHLYKEEPIPATGDHTWECSYVWTPEAPGTKAEVSCAGTATCSVCGTVETETVSATYRVIRETDGLTDGEAAYDAAFTKACFTQQTLSIAIPKEEHVHTWTYAYAWEETQCTATRTCQPCGTSESETAQGQLARTHPATKDAAGKYVYTADFTSDDFDENFTEHAVEIPANTAFSISNGGTQSYTFDAVAASTCYYIEMKLSAPTTAGYVGIAHWADSSKHFYDVVSYSGTENYYHAFSSVIGGAGRVYSEPAKYFAGSTIADFGTNGMTIASLRMYDKIYTFINGQRIATYLVENELANASTVPALYFSDNSGYYNGSISDIVIVTGANETYNKLAQLTYGSSFSYANTPNWNSGTHTDATFNADGFTYAYNSGVSTGDRRFVTGVNDRVFLAGNYYYQYEISGDMAFANGSNVYGLLYNWINTKSLTQYGNYKHEVNFCLKLNGDKLQRLTFDKGSGANGDGSSGWVSNTTTYGGRNDLEGDAEWQEAYKGGLIIRIERTVVNSTTDKYVISVTAKTNPELKLVSTPIEVSDATYGGYNWILFGTQSVDCTISNVTYGRS